MQLGFLNIEARVYRLLVEKGWNSLKLTGWTVGYMNKTYFQIVGFLVL